jgi:hypothetical protein
MGAERRYLRTGRGPAAPLSVIGTLAPPSSTSSLPNEVAGSAAKERVVYPLQKRVINPIVILAHDLGIPPPGDALLGTTGRRTVRPWRTPVRDGLDGEGLLAGGPARAPRRLGPDIHANPPGPDQGAHPVWRRVAARDRAHPCITGIVVVDCAIGAVTSDASYGLIPFFSTLSRTDWGKTP